MFLAWRNQNVDLQESSRNWKLSYSKFVSKDTDPFLKVFFLLMHFLDFYYGKSITRFLHH